MLLLALDGLGEMKAELCSQKFTAEAFGSWEWIVERGRRRFRIVYDGKDSDLVIEELSSPGTSNRPPVLISCSRIPRGLDEPSLRGILASIEKATT
jgi:hypothetical protein